MRSIILACLFIATPLSAQTGWTTVQQLATWLNTSVDQAISPRTALWFDGHWRRMGLGAEPQQVLLRPGLQLTLRPGLRVGGGYAFVATAPYGDSPNASPTREHRAWQQLSLASQRADVSISQRVRWEQRWSGAVTDSSLAALSYQQRLRYSLRLQRNLPTAARRERPLLGFVANEFFLPVGHSDGAERRLQNRAILGIGLPLSDKQRVELSYMHQWNRITPRETHEVNHTMVLSWSWRSQP